MSYFAKCDATANASARVVTDVISADQAFVDTQSGFWVQTSYNTYGNVHYAPSPPAEPFTPDGGVALRGNYAGIGFIYDQANNVFYPPQPFPSWTIEEPDWTWTPPSPMPKDGKSYDWDEANQKWVAAKA